MGYKYILKKHKWLGFRGEVFYDMSIPIRNSGFNYIIQTYGANLDTLLNVVNSQEFFFGFRVGIGLAGANYCIYSSSACKRLFNF
nr:outer membrane beta-barrel protein [Helicobacter cetorum]